MRKLIINLLIFLPFLLNSNKALSQSDSTGKPIGWDFDLTLGRMAGSQSKDLNTILVNAGYNYNCVTKNHLPLIFEVNRAVTNYFMYGLNFFMFNQDLVSMDGYNICNFKTIALSPLVSLNYKNFIGFSAGPSFISISYVHPTGSSFSNDKKFQNLGINLKSFIELPAKSRIHFRVEFQYSTGGKIDPDFSIESRSAQYHYTTIHATNVHANYFYTGVGLGIRFYKNPKHIIANSN
jgi:hypothetical protein